MQREDRAMSHELDVKTAADARRFFAGVSDPGAILIEQIRREVSRLRRRRIKVLWISLLLADGDEDAVTESDDQRRNKSHGD